MKKITLYLVLLAPVISQAKSFECNDIVSNEIKQVSEFRSTEPVLQSTLTFFNPDGSVKSETTTVFVSKTKACDIPVSFQTDCKVIEKENHLGYDFYFKCQKQNLVGELYIDETGYGRLSCGGPTVSQFFDCVAQ